MPIGERFGRGRIHRDRPDQITIDAERGAEAGVRRRRQPHRQIAEIERRIGIDDGRSLGRDPSGQPLAEGDDEPANGGRVLAGDMPRDQGVGGRLEIGRASCRERVCLAV